MGGSYFYAIIHTTPGIVMALSVINFRVVTAPKNPMPQYSLALSVASRLAVTVMKFLMWQALIEAYLYYHELTNG